MSFLSLWMKSVAANRCWRYGLVGALAVSSVQAQTAVDLRTQAKSVDFSNAVSTKTSKAGAILPAVCQVAETYFLTTAPAGKNLYGCNPTNTWTLLSGSSSGDNIQGNPVAAGSATSIGQYYAWDPALGQFRLFSLGALFSVTGTTTNVATESVVQYGTGAVVPASCNAYGQLFFESDGTSGDKLYYCNGASFEKVTSGGTSGALDGPFLPFGAGGSGSSFISGTANRVYLYQFLLTAPMRVGRLSFYVSTAAAAAKASFALYDSSRNKLAEGVPVDASTVGSKAALVSPDLIMAAGVYYIAYAVNSTTAAVTFLSTPSTLIAPYNANAQRIGFCTQTANLDAAAGTTFPGTCTITTLASNTTLPLVILEP